MISEQHKIRPLSGRALAAGVLCVSAYLMAHTVNAWVADSLALQGDAYRFQGSGGSSEPTLAESRNASRQFAQDILASGLFVLPPPSSVSAPAAASNAPPPAPLNIASKVSLIGVIMGIDGQDRAILEELSGRKQALYRVSQRVSDAGELVAIRKDRVLFREGEQEEWLELAIVKQTASAGRFPLPEQQPVWIAPPMLPAAPLPPGRRAIDRAQLTQLVSTPESYMNEARFQPHFSGNGQLDGFRIDGIRQVGVLEKAGLQNEDVLAGVNGAEIRDPGRLWEIFKQLQHERTVRLNVVRQSQPMTLVVEIRG